MFNVRLRTRECDGYTTVALRGELDLANAAGVTAALIAAADRQPLVVVDLAGLSFIDVSGVAALVRARGHARDAGGDLCLCAPRDQALRVLAIVRPVDALSVHSSVKEAADSAGRFRGAVVPAQRQAPHQL